MIRYTDTTLMSFGRHKGTALANVPAADLIYYYENYQLSPALKEYIRNNLEVLKAKIKRSARSNAR